MTIRLRVLDERAKLNILMDKDNTLDEAFKALKTRDYAENEAYLVVSMDVQQYRVSLFAHLNEILFKLGPNSLNRPLAELPIPPASEIVPMDTPRTSGEIIKWVASHPHSRVVITDLGQFKGLLANEDMGGAWDSRSAAELHGEYACLRDNPAATVKLSPPICPHCGHQDFYELNDKLQFYCIQCRQIVG